MAPRVYPSARDRILDAAEKLILTRGVGQLGVEAIAAEAKVSKGGFFHHFATKDDLLLAVLDRLIAQVDAVITAVAANDPEPRGARLRAQIALTFDTQQGFVARSRALAIAFLETSSAQPAMIERSRRVNAAAFARDMAEDIPLGRAILVQLALDGFALAQGLGTIALDVDHVAALRDSLMALARPEVSPPARAGKARASKKGRQS